MTDPIPVPPPAAPGFSADLLSDIHADRWKDEAFDYAAHKKNDIAIIAGDLAEGTALSVAELKKIAAVYKTVLFVDGNHEFRKDARLYNFDFEAVEKELRDGIAGIPNVTYLRDKPFVKDGVAVIGRNGHWDYKIADGITEKDAINDAAKMFKSTFNEAASFSKLARRDYYALRDQVIALNKDPSIHAIVVVTHTVPRKELLSTFLNGTSTKIPLAWHSRAGSGIMNNLLKYDAQKKIKFWLFGHQHSPRQQKVDSILYHGNPRGRKGEGIKDYKPVLIAFPTGHP